MILFNLNISARLDDVCCDCAQDDDDDDDDEEETDA